MKITTVLPPLILCLFFMGCDWPEANEYEDPLNVESPVEESREEMIERELNLPPEPDKAENDSTILGVDVNNNNIRDDVERKVSFDLYDKPAEMKRQIRYAQLWTETVLAEGDEGLVLKLRNEISLNHSCLYIGVETEEEFFDIRSKRIDYESIIANNDDRFFAYKKSSSSLGGHFLNSPSDEEIQTYCSQFNN